jgi:TRAP-type C4-dicarboxylate transport system substrate-binding protein
MTGRSLLLAALLAAFATPSLSQEKSVAQKYLDGEAKLSTPFNYNGPAITLRYSTFLGKAGATPELYEKLWKRLKDDTNGKITIQPFWSNSIADAQTGGFESVASGLVDIGTCYTQLNPGGFDLHFGVQLPTMLVNSSAGTMVFNEVYAQYLRETYEKRNVYMARVGLTPPQQLYSKDPIRTFDDMKGKRAWSVGKVANMAVASLGLSPTSLKISDLYPGFQSGVIDVAPMHDAGAPLFRLTDIAKYRTRVDLWTNPNEHCINKRRWDQFPAEVKDYLYHWFQVWTQVESQLYYDFQAERARDAMQKQGIQFVEFSEPDQNKVKAAYENLIKTWVEEQEAAGRPGRAFVDAMLAARTKYDAMTLDQRMDAVLQKPVPGMISTYTKR